MFLTIDNTASGFDPEFNNLKEYDFFFLSSNLSNDFITLSDEVSFKLFNDCLYCSLNRKKPVFILKNSSSFNKEWIDLVSGKHFLIHDDFIFINISIRSKVKELTPVSNEKISLKVLSNNYSQL
jgi:hypothetical protein